MAVNYTYPETFKTNPERSKLTLLHLLRVTICQLSHRRRRSGLVFYAACLVLFLTLFIDLKLCLREVLEDIIPIYLSRRKSSTLDRVTATFGLDVVGNGGGGPRDFLADRLMW